MRARSVPDIVNTPFFFNFQSHKDINGSSYHKANSWSNKSSNNCCCHSKAGCHVYDNSNCIKDSDCNKITTIQFVIAIFDSVLYYIFEHDNPIDDGQTIAGLENGDMNPDIKWKVQYEDSLIQPVRTVIDINMGEYASGTR